jgi:2,3-bisphosphoglycerate-independent phosphoglycerate mutase
MGVDLGNADIAYRCNLVTIDGGIMRDFSAGHISSKEGAELIHALGDMLVDVRLYPGISYRNLLVVPLGEGATTTPPHDIVGDPVAPYVPRGADARILLDCMEWSRGVYEDHPVNAARKRAGKPPATSIWPWSGGKRPALMAFQEKYGVSGAMISAVDLLRGIARLAGMDVITVPGATGYLDTDYQAKARYALDVLKHVDFLYLHVEAIDEAGHLGSIEEKVKAIERFDEMVGTILAEFEGIVAVLPDHPTPIRIKTHTRCPVPFAILGKGSDGCSCFSEREAEKGSFGLIDAGGFLPLLLTED